MPNGSTGPALVTWSACCSLGALMSRVETVGKSERRRPELYDSRRTQQFVQPCVLVWVRGGDGSSTAKSRGRLLLVWLLRDHVTIRRAPWICRRDDPPPSRAKGGVVCTAACWSVAAASSPSMDNIHLRLSSVNVSKHSFFISLFLTYFCDFTAPSWTS